MSQSRIKSLFFCIVFLVLSGGQYEAMAFVGEDLGLDLYESIDEGIIELDRKNYEYELKNGIIEGSTVATTVNYILGVNGHEPCISPNLGITELETIVIGQDTETLTNLIIDACKETNGDVSITTVTDIMGTLVSIHNLTKQKAEQKSDEMYKISRIGLYADGNTDNSSFDLIKDLQDIDAVIFTEELDYFGETPMDNDFFGNTGGNNTLRPKTPDLSSLINARNTASTQGANTTAGSSSTPLPLEGIGGNQYVCSTDNDQSGLNPEVRDALLADAASNSPSSSLGSLGNLGGSLSHLSGSLINNRLRLQDLSGGFTAINDNSRWPCNGFFCITVEFIMYNHTLLGGGATKTIESVVLGSNEHLKKFAYSSKIPAVQTTQNFQLGLSNLNLPDIFHMSFDISKKPVPILNVEKTTPEHSQKDDMLSSDSMLREYYKSMSLDYERRNSMIRYTSSEEELKTITESAGLTPTTIEEKLNTLKKIQAIEAKRIELLSKTIDAKTQAKELAVFDNDLMHLQLFADNLAAHAEQIQAIIKKMVDIKIRHND